MAGIEIATGELVEDQKVDNETVEILSDAIDENGRLTIKMSKKDCQELGALVGGYFCPHCGTFKRKRLIVRNDS